MDNMQSDIIRNISVVNGMPFGSWKEVEKLQKPERMMTPKEHHLPDTRLMHTEQSLYKFKPDRVPALRGGSSSHF